MIITVVLISVLLLKTERSVSCHRSRTYSTYVGQDVQYNLMLQYYLTCTDEESYAPSVLNVMIILLFKYFNVFENSIRAHILN